MLAASGGYTDLVRELIRAKADVNAQRVDGMTALMLAAFYGQADAARLLVRAGADVNLAVKRYNSEYTALWYAENNKNTEIAAMLRKAGAR